MVFGHSFTIPRQSSTWIDRLAQRAGLGAVLVRIADFRRARANPRSAAFRDAPPQREIVGSVARGRRDWKARFSSYR
ncbi:hypothetical protein [Oceanicella actignis]|uniref:hypothetical protein n=1 Tax=Oceanicella actignis TaxID=1189325 RepID=UPI0009323347|nr:hypothetical protein [Oceanicella actignis]